MTKLEEILKQYQDGFIDPLEGFSKLYPLFSKEIKLVKEIEKVFQDLIEFKHVDNIYLAYELLKLKRKIEKTM